jgi:hypothetical protein
MALSNTAATKAPPVKTPLPVTAAVAWASLGLQWMEMMAASSHVIARRTQRSPTPAQWFRMGSEKVEAAVASGNAMTRQMIGFPMHDPMAMWHAWARVLSSGVAPYRARAVRNARVNRGR